MENTLFEQNGGTYTQQGDYLLPDIRLFHQPEYEIGVWGNRRRQYLKQHHRIKYYNMLTQCTLYPHLADIEQQAQAMFLRLVDQLFCNRKRYRKAQGRSSNTLGAIDEQHSKQINRNC